MSHKDYSATPLSKKLGAKPGACVVVFFTTSRAELERRFAALRDTLEWDRSRGRPRAQGVGLDRARERELLADA